jgi:pyruvate dehydrogenase E1 component alpha subunit
VATFGDGAMTQGMLLESFNLAVAWSLPVLFVCKNNRWAITTESSSVSGGRPIERARGFGLPTWDVDGASLKELDDALRELLPRLRRGKGPAFLHARCGRLDGHFLGDPMLKMAKHPMTDGKELFSEVAAATMARDGGGVLSRASSMITMMTSLGKVRGQARGGRDDPLQRARRELGVKRDQLDALDDEARNEVAAAIAEALGEAA